MDYKQYQVSRDSAWRIMIDLGIDRLPIRVSSVCKQLGIQISSLQSAQHVLKKILPSDYMAEIRDGLAIMWQGRPYVFYNAEASHGRNRFTLAHELGHVVLGHLNPRWKGTAFRTESDPLSNHAPMEREANVFASRLLAPAGVLMQIGIQSAAEIAALCDISQQAAEYRWKRLQLLYERDAKFKAQRGHGTVGMSPLERQVLQQFADYINMMRICGSDA